MKTIESRELACEDSDRATNTALPRASSNLLELNNPNKKNNNLADFPFEDVRGRALPARFFCGVTAGYDEQKCGG